MPGVTNTEVLWDALWSYWQPVCCISYRVLQLGDLHDDAMNTSQICHTSLSFLMNCDAKIKWHQKDSRNLVQLLVMLVSTYTILLELMGHLTTWLSTKRNGFRRKDFLRMQWIQHWKVNKFLARLISTRTKFKMISVMFVLFRQLVSDQWLAILFIFPYLGEKLR